MRLPCIPPETLTEAQKPVYDDMRKGIEAKFNDFEAIRSDGALMGPWNPWLHAGRTGNAIWELTKVLSFEATLPAEAREIAILVVGAHFNAAYEMYAHVNVAEEKGMDEDMLATLVAGVKPEHLDRTQGVAYDVAYALVTGKVLPRPTYDAAARVFGPEGVQELIHLVGLYCMVSCTLNGFAVPIPEEGAA